MDIEKIIEKCRKNDKNAIAFLYDKYVNLIFRVCLRYMGNTEDAEDCVSGIFIKILSGLQTAKFENDGKFKAWICRITVNECLMKLRTKIKFEPLDGLNNWTCEDNILDGIEVSFLLKLIQALPTGYRTVLNMYAIEGYSHQEIAEQLGISAGTSKSQLSKARAELQEKIMQFKTL